jgi:hypothetical protein
MKLWSMLVGLVAVALVAAVVVAAEGEKKGGKGGKGMAPMSAADLWKAAGLKDADKLTEAKYVETLLKNVPEENKEKAKTRTEARAKALFGDKKELSQADYTAAVEKMQADMKAKFKDKGGKGKKGGEKKEN